MNLKQRILQEEYLEGFIDENIFPDSSDIDKKHIPYVFINNNQEKFYPNNHSNEEYPLYGNFKLKRKNDFNYYNNQNAINFNDYNSQQIYMKKNEKINNGYIDYDNTIDNMIHNNKNVIKKAKTNYLVYRISKDNKIIGYKKLNNEINGLGIKYISSFPRNVINTKQMFKNQDNHETDYNIMYSERKTTPYMNVKKFILNNNYTNNINDDDYDDNQYYNKIIKRNTFNNSNTDNTLINNVYTDVKSIKKKKKFYKFNNTPDIKKNKYNQDSPNINENMKRFNKNRLNKKFLKIPNNFNFILSTSHNNDDNERINTDSSINNNIQTERIERRNKKIYTRKDLKDFFQNNKTFNEQNKIDNNNNIESIDEDNHYLNNNNSKTDIKQNRNKLGQLKKHNSINEMNNKPKIINKYTFKKLNRKELIEKVKEINNNNRAKYNTGNIVKNEKTEKKNNIIYIPHTRNKTKENEIRNSKSSDIITSKVVNKMNINDNEMSTKKIKINNQNKDKAKKIQKIPTYTKKMSYDMEDTNNKNKNLIIKKQKSRKIKRSANEIQIINNKSNCKKNQEVLIPFDTKKNKDLMNLEICNVSNIKIYGRYNKSNNKINTNDKNIIIIINNNDKNKVQNNIPILNSNNNSLNINNKYINDINKNNNSNKIIINNNIQKNQKLNINNIININIIKQNSNNNSDKQNIIKNNEIINNKESNNKNININNNIINNNNFNINENKNYINNITEQIEKQDYNSNNKNKNLNNICVPQNIIHLNINSDKEKVKEPESNIQKTPRYNNTDNNNNNIEKIKPVIQHKIERKRPVYSLPPSQKRSVSQGKPFTLINKYYDENFILEDDDEENIKINDDSFGDSEVKTNINILNNQTDKNKLCNVINNYLKKEKENENIKF